MKIIFLSMFFVFTSHLMANERSVIDLPKDEISCTGATHELQLSSDRVVFFNYGESSLILKSFLNALRGGSKEEIANVVFQTIPEDMDNPLYVLGIEEGDRPNPDIHGEHLLGFHMDIRKVLSRKYKCLHLINSEGNTKIVKYNR